MVINVGMVSVRVYMHLLKILNSTAMEFGFLDLKEMDLHNG